MIPKRAFSKKQDDGVVKKGEKILDASGRLKPMVKLYFEQPQEWKTYAGTTTTTAARCCGNQPGCPRLGQCLWFADRRPSL